MVPLDNKTSTAGVQDKHFLVDFVMNSGRSNMFMLHLDSCQGEFNLGRVEFVC